MAVSRVVEHIGLLTRTDTRHHAGRHGAKACPRYDLSCTHLWEALIDPIDERADSVGADVFVKAIKFRGARNSETI